MYNPNFFKKHVQLPLAKPDSDPLKSPYRCPSGGMVDTLDSKSNAARRIGSSPISGTSSTKESVNSISPALHKNEVEFKKLK